jgi:hypothetical protein
MLALQILFFILSLIALGFFGFGLVRWQQGKVTEDEEKIFQAKRLTLAGGVGLIIFAVVFGISLFLKTSPTPPPVIKPEEPVKSGGGRGLPLDITHGKQLGNKVGQDISKDSLYLGAGIIESHYPLRNQKEVPLNTVIAITFKEPILAEDFICDTGESPPRADRAKEQTQGKYPAACGASFAKRNGADQGLALGSIPFIKAGGTNLINFQNVRIKKTNDPLGRELKDISVEAKEGNTFFILKPLSPLAPNNSYTVFLSSSIRRASGLPAFGNNFYTWTFSTGSLLDNTPPRVLKMQPDFREAESLNVTLEITFSEPVIIESEGVIASLPLRINRALNYKAIDINGSEPCGENACEEPLFCFPAKKTVKGELKASLIKDMAGNSLDGNANGVPEESPKDNYSFSLKIGEELKNTKPVIIQTNPLNEAKNVDLEAPLQVLFDRIIAKSTLSTKTIGLIPRDKNWWLMASDDSTTKVFIYHDPLKPLTTYYPYVTKGIKDLYQNCFFPPQGP